MQEFKGWNFRDWEREFSKTPKGHKALVRELKKIIQSKYHLEVYPLTKHERRELWITT